MNPGSRSGQSRRSFHKIRQILDREKINYDLEITKSLEEAYQLSLEGNSAGYDVIVAVGGDGTINRVLNGFYGLDGRRCSKAKFGVVYTGTSPDFCKSYDIPLSIDEAVRAVLKQRTKKIQVGKIVYAEDCLEELDGKPVCDEPESGARFITRYFACCANIGIGAALARKANSGIRGVLGDKLGTFMALVRTLISYRSVDYLICADGKRERVSKVHNISVGKTFHIASGIKVQHQLENGDHRLYRFTVQNIKLRALPGIINKIYSGKRVVNNEMMSLDYLKMIEVLGNKRNPELEFDGDPAGYLPCRISMADDDLELIY
ncbi:MAG: diacylglycerol kinase family protein [Dehalobacterium sp.]